MFILLHSQHLMRDCGYMTRWTNLKKSVVYYDTDRIVVIDNGLNTVKTDLC